MRIELSDSHKALITSFLGCDKEPDRISILSSDGTKINPDEWDQERLILGMDSKRTVYVLSYDEADKTFLALIGDEKEADVKITFRTYMRLVSVNGINIDEEGREFSIPLGMNGIAILINQ